VGIPRPTGGDSEVKWWGYRGQQVGTPRPSGGNIEVNWWGNFKIKAKGRGIEVKVKKSGEGACPLQLPLLY
jgi:hypothetical protein